MKAVNLCRSRLLEKNFVKFFLKDPPGLVVLARPGWVPSSETQVIFVEELTLSYKVHLPIHS